MKVRRGLRAALLAAWLASGGAAPRASEPEPAPPPQDGRQLALRVEESLRSDATYLEATLRIVTPRRERTLGFRLWDDRLNRRAFIRLLAPPEDAGTSFLRLQPNVWTLAPDGEGPLRIPPGSMLRRWMGSDFVHDDWLHEASLLDDYRHRLLGVEAPDASAPGIGAHRLEYLPHEPSPFTWGRILAWVETRRGTPLRMDFFDAAGERVRELRFEDLREVQSRHFPHRWRMIHLDKKGRESVLEVRVVRFNQTFDDAIFTTRHLRQGG